MMSGESKIADVAIGAVRVIGIPCFAFPIERGAR
jgi:hypothetical protein